MYLDVYFCSLEPQKIPDAIFELLPRLEVSISSFGTRVISVNDLKRNLSGSISVRNLAIRYIHAIDWVEIHGTLAQRLRCYDALQKIDALYQAGNRALDNTLLYRYVLPYIKKDSYSQFSELKRVHEQRIFGFSPEDFSLKWNESVKREYKMHDGRERWVATREMVQRALDATRNPDYSQKTLYTETT